MRRRIAGVPPLLGGVVALALLLLGGAALVLSADSETTRTLTVAGANRPVNPEAGDPDSIAAHNSPGLVRSPVDEASLAIANRVDEPDFSCALHVSADGGRTWRQRAIPAPAGPARKCYAPDVVFDAAGTLFLVFATLQGRGNVPDALWVTSSRDGGRTLTRPQRATGAIPFQARLVADPAAPGRLYLTWLHAPQVGLLRLERPGNPIRMARSDDGGATWGAPSRVSDPRRQRVVAPSPAAGADGELYVLYLDLGDDRLDYDGGHRGRGGPPYGGTWQLVLARSRDGGRRWAETVVEPRLTPTERFVVFLPPFPALAVDPARGRLYASVADGRLGDADVWLWDSADRGATWRRRRVNDTPARDGTRQYLPRLALAPGGRLDVLYYDRRADPRDVRNEVSLQSTTAGRDFTPRLRLSDGSFDSRIGFGSERDLADLGGRLGLVSRAGDATAVWTDTRAGSQGRRRQDLAQANVAVSDRRVRSRTDGAWLGGLALLLGGCAIGVLALLSERRARQGSPA